MSHYLETVFPRLNDGRWSVTSPQDEDYNCIAWAAEDNSHVWWPNERVYWPIPSRINTVECFLEAFATLGYVQCSNGKFEIGYQKVALYTDVFRSPKHMARQTLFGQWLSKLGPCEDIMHCKLSQLNGTGPIPNGIYGAASAYMKRSWWKAYRIRRERKKLELISL